MSSRQEDPRVLVIHDRPDDFGDLLRSRFPDLPIAYATAPDEVESKLRESNPQAVFSIKHPGFPAASHRPILEHPSVEWIQIGGSGFEHFLGWDTQRITLTNCAGVLSRFLAETVTGAMLMLNGKLLSYAAQQREGVWRAQAFRPLCEQTLLVVGVGVIGGYIADNAKALGMRVLGTRRSAAPHRSVDEMHPSTALPNLLAEADVVSLHVRATEETTHLIDREALAAMKPDAMLINTSRGAVIDEAALVETLQSGRLRAAYLDVFESEPLPADSPLWRLDNVFITPHASDFVPDWPRRFAALFADNLERWIAGEPLLNVVDAASAA